MLMEQLTNKSTPIGATSLFTFNVFDGYYFTMKTKTFKFNEEQTYISSIFLSKDIGYKVIRGVTSDNDKVYIDPDGNIIVKAETAETSGNFTLTYNNSIVGDTKTCTVPFHFMSKDAHYVTFDGANKVAVLKDHVINFPIPEEREGYVFDGWYLDGQRVDMSKQQKMADHDLNYVSKYVVPKFYNVYYYDGFMNLVYVETVQEGKAAIGPDAATRDKNMGSKYVFAGWDRDLSCITENTKAYAIYVKVGQDND